MQFTCEQCGIDFKRDRVSRFCSMACKGIASRNPARPCERCGVPFHPPMGRRDTARFCSRPCSGASRDRRITKVCEVCASTFVVTTGRYGARFCGNACANVWQGRNRDRFTCTICAAEFNWSPSRAKNNNVKYCSIECRNADPAQRARLLAMTANQAGASPSRLEAAGYAALDASGLRHERQVPLFDKFVVDAFLPDHGIVVQFDGDYWHGNPAKFPEPSARQRRRIALDRSQDAYLTRCGLRVLRFWECEVHANPASVEAGIRSVLLERQSA